MSFDRLRSSALWYVERFPATRATVERFLDRRIRRACENGDRGEDRSDDRDAAEAPAMISAILDDLSRMGLIDDAKVAESLARSRLERGESPRRILARTAAKGIDQETAQAALEQVLAERGEAEPLRAAAVRLAARKKLGPYRPAEDRMRYRMRDLRVLARQGFSAEIAYWIIDADDAESLA